MRIIGLMWLLVVTVISWEARKMTSFLPRRTDWFLPGLVLPFEYTLNLKTHIDKFNDINQTSFTYEGEVSILIFVLLGSRNIKIHSNDSLTLVKGTILSTSPDSQPSKVTFQAINPTTGILSLTNDENYIARGEYILSISFIGIHRNNSKGFYRGYYFNANSEKRWFISTHFAANHAREAFPCFDEPTYKANFTISVELSTELIDDGYGVLSNMPIEREDRNSETGITKITFQKSAIKLSTYLLAFIVSDFKASEASTFLGGKPLRTWGIKRLIDDKSYFISQTVGPDALNILQSILKIDNGLPKLDLVGIPEKNVWSMGNWGLFTYTKGSLFYEDKREFYSSLQWKTIVLVHELSHQWFGGLVTPEWWSNLWLNEGFATFMGYYITDKLSTAGLNTSSWQLVGQMVVNEMQASAFAIDALNTSHPLSTQVTDPSIYESYADDISHAKGASVLRMWMHAMGEELFYKAVSNYLKRGKKVNATPSNLKRALMNELPDRHILMNSNSAFEDWYSKPGYPIVTAKRHGDFYRITQERFLLNGVSKDKKWTIPISYSTSKEASVEDTSPRVLFRNVDSFIDVKHENSSWILLNLQQTGYYRVNYDEGTWLKLTETLFTEPQKINNINRAQLIDDAFSLARSSKGYVSYKLALTLTKYLVNETDLIPWKAALRNFDFIDDRLVRSKSKEKLTRFLAKLIQPRFKELSLTAQPGDSHTTSLLRQNIGAWACYLDIQECVDEALRRYVYDSYDSIDADVYFTVLCSYVRHGDDDVWSKIWDLFENTYDKPGKTIYIDALGCSRDPVIIYKYLNYTLVDTYFSGEEKIAVFVAVIERNSINVDAALNFISQNLEGIALSYGGTDPLGVLLSIIAQKLGTNEDLQAMQAIKTNIELRCTLSGRAGLSIDSAISTVRSNLEWAARHEAEIATWLDENDANANYIAPKYLLMVSFIVILIC